MSRIARIILQGIPYHITQRGNGPQVFFDERDYSLYLDLLRQYSNTANLRILAYCLMPNHATQTHFSLR
jgi:putative transposase